MKLVYDVSDWKKWWSMRLIIASAFFQAIVLAYATLPEDWLPSIPQYLKLGFAFGALATAGLSGVARVIQQPGLHRDDAPAATAGTKIIASVASSVEPQE